MGRDCNIVTHYWIEEFLISSGETYSRLKRELFEIFGVEVEIALRDDNDLKTVLNDTMIPTINKHLRQGTPPEIGLVQQTVVYATASSLTYW